MLLVYLSMHLPICLPLHHPLIHALLSSHKSIITVHPAIIKLCRCWRSVIHSSVSQSISHASIQSATAQSSWSHQFSQVMWVMKKKRQIYTKAESWPTYHLSVTHFMAPHISVSTDLSLFFSLSPHCLNSWLIFSQKVDSALSPGTSNPQMTVVSLLLSPDWFSFTVFWKAVTRDHTCRTPELRKCLRSDEWRLFCSSAWLDLTTMILHSYGT